MSLLNLIREQAIFANVQKGGEAWKMITACIQSSAKAGDHDVSITVTSQNPEEVKASIEALKLSGFYASFHDEGHRDIHVSWMPLIGR